MKDWKSLIIKFTPIFAFICALLVGAVLIIIIDANPTVAYFALISGVFGNFTTITNTIVKATPLLLVGVGICIAFRSGAINIGGEGQLVVGALSATIVCLAFDNLPGWILIIISLFAGLLGGAIWAGIAGFLKAYCKVNELLSTIMLNYIAVYLMNYLLGGPLMDPQQKAYGSFIPQTSRLVKASDLPRLVPTRLHLGVLIALFFAVLVYILLWRTTIGFRLRMIGNNLDTSRASGIDVEKYMVFGFLLSGAVIGLGGAIEVLGVTHRMFTDGSAFGFTGSAGFNGIIVALFGKLHPIGAIPASLLFGALLTGANKMQRVVQIPSAFVSFLNGLIVIFIAGSEFLVRRQKTQHIIQEKFKNNKKIHEERE